MKTTISGLYVLLFQQFEIERKQSKLLRTRKSNLDQTVIMLNYFTDANRELINVKKER